MATTCRSRCSDRDARSYGLPESISSGEQVWKVVNEGEQPHEFIRATR